MARSGIEDPIGQRCRRLADATQAKTRFRARMTDSNVAVVVLAAGRGTRMESDIPKALHAVAGQPMLSHVLRAVAGVEPRRTIVVVGQGMEAVARLAAGAATVVQERRLGTADAASRARPELDGFEGDVLVLFADSPLITPATMRRLVDARRNAADPAVVVLGFRPGDAASYGRLVTDGAGALEAIVELRDADDAQRRIGLCNGGVMVVDGAVLFEYLSEVGNDNAKGEYYLTDLVAIARAHGRECAVVECPEEEAHGVNSRADLAAVEAILQRRLRAAAMTAGVTMVDPATVYLSADTTFGRDVVVEPHVFFGPGVAVGDGVRIGAFSHIEGAAVAAGASIGPYARLRPGAEIGESARIGNFVEVKAATVETGAKVNHLAYIGDARVGEGANVGAGTITCNYDGVAKHRTDIGAGAFIGSNSALVAPVKIGDGAVVGAGSAVSRDVPAGALALARAEQSEKPGWAARFLGRVEGRSPEVKAAKRSREG